MKNLIFKETTIITVKFFKEPEIFEALHQEFEYPGCPASSEYMGKFLFILQPSPALGSLGVKMLEE